MHQLVVANHLSVNALVCLDARRCTCFTRNEMCCLQIVAPAILRTTSPILDICTHYDIYVMVISNLTDHLTILVKIEEHFLSKLNEKCLKQN